MRLDILNLDVASLLVTCVGEVLVGASHRNISFFDKFPLARRDILSCHEANLA